MKLQSKQHLENCISRYPILLPCKDSLYTAAEWIISCYKNSGMLLVCGNGGSAADSLHIVGELMKGFILPRHPSEDLKKRLYEICPDSADYLLKNLQMPLPALSLVGETGLNTAFANDCASDLCFAQQVLGYGRKGDILLCISTSGNSANVIYAAAMAKAKGLSVISLTGFTGGKLKNCSDCLINVPETETYKIQELHLPVYHALCMTAEEEFFGGTQQWMP